MKPLLRSLLLAGLLLLVVAAGCASKAHLPRPSEEVALDAIAAREPAQPQLAPMPAAGAPASDAYAAAGSRPAMTANAGRKIILTANLQLVVKDTENTVAAIKGLVAGQEGYVAAANLWRNGNRLQAQLTVRVPAARLETFLEEVKKLAVRVEREESGGQDVTEEYVDLSAQLRNLEATETELRTLLTDVREKSGKAEDVMAVYRELVTIRGDIERIKGRMQYLDRSAEMATVNLQLSEREAEPIGQPGWQPVQTLRRALNALVEALKLGVDAGIWLVALGVPLVGLPVLAIWLIWGLVRRRRALAAKARAYEESLKQT